MTGLRTEKRQLRSGLISSASAAILLIATSAMAQQAAPASKPASEEVQEVVVTGFRSSLQSAISEKRRSVDMVDAIKAEDIGNFPDLNLAESLQRIPGIAIDRDGGEGRQITVRGLNSEFSRTRLNGLEALATAAGKDGAAGTNRGRGFDYNVFAADLFSALTVRKSMSAEVEEGSLGATIDLQTARPFDYKGFTMAASAAAGYNSVSKEASPRTTFLISNRWADGRLGALLSVAYETRNVLEESTTTTRWENSSSAGTAGRYKSYSTDGGKTFINIPTGTAAIIDPEALKVVNSLHPRIPRHNRYETDQKRLGITGAFQMRPVEGTLITLEGLYAQFGADRKEWEIEAISFSRGGRGLPASSVYDYAIDSRGVMTKGSFNDVDIRSESRFDELTTTFKQLGLTWDQTWSDRLSSKLVIGASNSLQDNPEQTTFTFESYDVDGYRYDYSDPTNPRFDYGKSNTGCKPDQGCYWTYSTSNSLGDRSLIRLRPNRTENAFDTIKFDVNYNLNDMFTLKMGVAKRHYEFSSNEFGRYTSAPQTRDEDAGGLIATLINADIAKYSNTVTVEGNTYLIPNLDLIRSTFKYDCRCTNEFGVFTMNETNSSSRNNNRQAEEDSMSYHVQLDFNFDVFGMPLRGNVGTRQVTTDLTATGFIGQGNNAVLTTVKRKYKNSLPSINLVLEPRNDVFIRFAAAQTMARPTLLSQTPGGGSINTSNLSVTTGNPNLDPVRSDNIDLSIEWYPDRDTLVSFAVFKKEIKSYIQRVATQVPLSQLGYQASDFGLTGDPIFTVTTPTNTPGGPLEGFEFSVQKPFTFLPGILKNTGGIFNYTHVDSDITYIITPSLTAPVIKTEKLLGLSNKSWNMTLYYEDERFNARVSYASRSGYLSQLNPGSSALFWGKNETKNLDAQVSWNVNKNVTVSLEAINLTDQADDKFIAYDTPQGNKVDDLMYEYSNTGRQFFLTAKYKY
ncbi:MAG: TonB-dependent receptor [Asticcacaulis sp.]